MYLLRGCYDSLGNVFFLSGNFFLLAFVFKLQEPYIQGWKILRFNMSFFQSNLEY